MRGTLLHALNMILLPEREKRDLPVFHNIPTNTVAQVVEPHDPVRDCHKLFRKRSCRSRGGSFCSKNSPDFLYPFSTVTEPDPDPLASRRAVGAGSGGR